MMKTLGGEELLKRFVLVAGAFGVWSALPVAMAQFGSDGGGRVAIVALVLAAESLLAIWFVAAHVKLPRLAPFALHSLVVGTAAVGLAYWRMDDLTWRETALNSVWEALIFSLAGGAAVAYLVSGVASIMLRWHRRRRPKLISRGEVELLPTCSRWAVSLVTVAGIVTASAWLLPVEVTDRQYYGFAWTGIAVSPLVAAVGVFAAVTVVNGLNERSAPWHARAQFLAVVSGVGTLALFALFYFGVGEFPAGPMADSLRALFGNSTLGLLVLTTMFGIGLLLEFSGPLVRRNGFGSPTEGRADSMSWLAEKDGPGARVGDNTL